MANIIVRVRMQKFFQYEVSSDAEALEKAKQEDLSAHLQFQVVNPKTVENPEIIENRSLSAPVENLKSSEDLSPVENEEDEF